MTIKTNTKIQREDLEKVTGGITLIQQMLVVAYINYMVNTLHLTPGTPEWNSTYTAYLHSIGL